MSEGVSILLICGQRLDSPSHILLCVSSDGQQDPQILYKRGITRYAQRRYADAIADLKATCTRDLAYINSNLACSSLICRG